MCVTDVRFRGLEVRLVLLAESRTRLTWTWVGGEKLIFRKRISHANLWLVLLDLQLMFVCVCVDVSSVFETGVKWRWGDRSEDRQKDEKNYTQRHSRVAQTGRVQTGTMGKILFSFFVPQYLWKLIWYIRWVTYKPCYRIIKSFCPRFSLFFLINSRKQTKTEIQRYFNQDHLYDPFPTLLS